MKDRLIQMKRAAPKSFAFLVIIPCVVVFLCLLAYGYFAQSYFSLPNCLIKQVTGLPCPSCGVTRSINALIHLRFFDSFRFHPLPILASIFLFSVWINLLINLLYRKVDKGFPYPFVWYYSILGIVLLSWVRQVILTISMR